MANINGTNGKDTLNGTNGKDTIFALDDDDVVGGEGGNDTIDGGNGLDTLFGGTGNDVLLGGGPGRDHLYGGAGHDAIGLDDTSRHVFVAGDGDIIFGDGSNSFTLPGGLPQGHDPVAPSQLGDDTIYGTGAADIILGDNNDDPLANYGGHDVIFAGHGADIVDGNGGNDFIAGEGGNDIMWGWEGKDTLLGGDGNDTLIGGAAADALDAGAGDDRIVYNAVSDSAGNKIDTIVGFESGPDRLSGDKIDITVLGGPGSDIEWAGTTATAFSAWYEAAAGGVELLADFNGDTAADFRVAVQGVSSLQHSDILGLVNHSPAITGPGAQTGREDAMVVFSVANGNPIFISDAENDVVTVSISRFLIGIGSNVVFTLSGTDGLVFAEGDGTADAALTFTGSVTDINNALDGFAFSGGGNYHGGSSFLIRASDADNPVPAFDFVDVTLLSVSDAPSGFDITVNANEDTPYTITPQHFGFADSEGPGLPADSLAGVKITTLPLAGSLTLSGVAVTGGQVISRADLNAGNLEFLAAPDVNGPGYASLTFQVQDSGSTANGGVNLDPTPNTITININSVNDSPAGTDNTVVTQQDTIYLFAAADFGFTDPHDSPSNAFLALKITTLPTAGTLAVTGGDVLEAGDLVSVASIDAGLLAFTPAAGASGDDYASFQFQVLDNGATSTPAPSYAGAQGSIDGGPPLPTVIFFPPPPPIGGAPNVDPTPNTMTIDVNPDLFIT